MYLNDVLGTNVDGKYFFETAFYFTIIKVIENIAIKKDLIWQRIRYINEKIR